LASSTSAAAPQSPSPCGHAVGLFEIKTILVVRNYWSAALFNVVLYCAGANQMRELLSFLAAVLISLVYQL
jgi:hypothetical protein